MTQPFVRVVDLETTGSRPPGDRVVEIGWQDVILGDDGDWHVALDRRGALYVDPQKPIPAVTMAVHHIRDQDVAGAPTWEAAAAQVLREEPRPLAFAAHRASFEQRFCTPALTGGADWICTWKGALRIWPDSPSFSNQVLRYWRDPTGLDHQTGLPAHRAFPDAYVTAHHLRDMLAEVSVSTLVGWNALPGLLPRVPYGPERGRSWHELDDALLQRFVSDKDTDVRYSALEEVARRSGQPRQAAPEPQARLF
ncbi:exodeoxyribonuclease X [Sphingomonas jejuensis]|uniref:Exodeoxyribonuclease X n=1 Tax=Sphingomonas jejuensis TaxID=904715 RepID=A0ABX0XHC4_9SPHN|nr:3'-5' exonuclease [Sphingomonas jejuensis]NJC32733.1 exodeoxyribonuclease X [Sphingomonas jejuensis]